MIVKSKVKYIQSLSQKKQRDEDGVFVAEGPKIINELLSEPGIELLELFALEEWNSSQFAIDPRRVVTILPHELHRISFLSTPNQVLGLFKKPLQPLLDTGKRVSLMADNIQDPGNLGSLIRCADWFGVDQVICSAGCADVFNPKTVQSTMGSLARVKVYYEDLARVIRDNPEISVYAATLAGKNISDLGAITEGVILIGNESRGISEELLQLSTERITIPRKGRAESLNAAVAAGIILSHLVN